MFLRIHVGCLLTLCCMLGCSNEPRRYGVGGTVTFKDAPIKFGSINFRSADGSTGAAQIVDGKYDIPAGAGLTLGKYQVAIEYPDPKIPMPMSDELPGEIRPMREMLPKKYNSASELNVEIKAQAKNEANFDLK